MQKIIPNPEKMSIFSTYAGREAWSMNLSTIYSSFYPVPLPESVEFEEDKEILFSKKPEDCARWTHWVNPGNGKTYIVIRQKDNEDGTRTVRVLDVNGNFVVEKDVVPKKIIQVDTFRGRESIDYGANIGFSHGDIVKKHIERNNPLCEVESIDIADCSTKEIVDENYVATFENILQRIWDGEKIDVINCSFGADFKPNPGEEAIESSGGIVNILNNEFSRDVANEIIPLLEEIIKAGTRVVFAAGNEGKDYVSLEFGASGVDVVGSIDDDGSVSEFSSARNFAKHYERGRYHYKAEKYGINMTGKIGPDISYENTPYAKFMGKKPEDLLLDDDEVLEYKKLDELRNKGKIDRFSYSRQMAKFKGKIIKLKDTSKTFPQAEIKDESKIYFSPERCLLLTTDKDGFLVPHLIRGEIKGTSFCAPVRSARIALNETMHEIFGRY